MLPRGIEHANPSETRVFLALCRIGRETGRGFATAREISDALGWRSKTHAHLCLRRLVRLGLVRHLTHSRNYIARRGLEFVPAARVGTTGANRTDAK